MKWRFLSMLMTILLAGCAGSDELVRASNCTKPNLIVSGQPIGRSDADRLNAENRAYRDCVKSYVSGEKAIVEKHQSIASAHATAANAATAEFNQYAADFKEILDGHESSNAIP